MKNLYEAPQILIEQVGYSSRILYITLHYSMNSVFTSKTTLGFCLRSPKIAIILKTQGYDKSHRQFCALFFQVQWNLFKPISSQCESQSSGGKDSEKDNNGGKMYHVWRDLEENYRKNYTNEDYAIRPRFYTLTPAETNTQDTPKLDGLVSSY